MAKETFSDLTTAADAGAVAAVAPKPSDVIQDAGISKMRMSSPIEKSLIMTDSLIQLLNRSSGAKLVVSIMI